MPILTPSCPFTFDTTVNFKAFGDMVGNGFRQLGWVKSTVGGQTDFSVLPQIIDDLSQWEIWGMGDALQQTHPCWLKIYYSKCRADSKYPRIWFEVGTGVNPDGTLQNPSPRVAAAGYTASEYTTTSVPHLIFGDSGNIYFIINESNVTYRTLWACGRLRNTQDWTSNGGIWVLNRVVSYTSLDLPWDGCNLFEDGRWVNYEPLPRPYARSADTLKWGSDVGFLPICNLTHSAAVPVFYTVVAHMPKARTPITIQFPTGNVDHMWMGDSVNGDDVLNLYYDGKTWGIALPWNWT